MKTGSFRDQVTKAVEKLGSLSEPWRAPIYYAIKHHKRSHLPRAEGSGDGGMRF